MKMAFISYFVLIILLTHLWSSDLAETCVEINPELPPTFHYERASCSSDSSWLKYHILRKTYLYTESACAHECYSELDCRYAIFTPGNIISCYLASDVYQETNQVVANFESSNVCVVLKITPRLRCANRGVPDQFSCSCPSSHFGRYCQGNVTGFCQDNIWTTTDSFSWMNSSQFQIKFAVSVSNNNQSFTEIHHLDDITILGSSLSKICQFNGLLTLDIADSTFRLPPSLSFGYAGFPTESVTRSLVGLDGGYEGEEVQGQSDGVSLFFLREDVANVDRMTSDFYKNGHSKPRLINGLSNGQRLVHREPIRVEFKDDVIFQVLTEKAGLRDDVFPLEQFYVVYKKIFNDEWRYFAGFRVANGSKLFGGADNNPDHVWALDDCWYLMESVLGFDRFTAILMETLLRGQDVRILMDTSISSDVLEVTFTDQDVAAVLAPYLSPFDSSRDIGEGTVVYSIISRHRTLVTCKMIFQHGEVIELQTTDYESSVEWIFSKRKWLNVFSVNNNGQVVFGGVAGLYSSAKAGRNVRVCVEYPDALNSCFGGKSLVVEANGTVLLQSRPAVRPSFNGSGILMGMDDDECLRVERLVSTAGWIKSMAYSEGNPNFKYEENVQFKTISWFVEL